MIILDSNVLAELMRPKPSPRIVAWVAKQPATELFTTSITEAEISCGIGLLAKGKRREGLLAVCGGDVGRGFPNFLPPVVFTLDLHPSCHGR